MKIFFILKDINIYIYIYIYTKYWAVPSNDIIMKIWHMSMKMWNKLICSINENM